MNTAETCNERAVYCVRAGQLVEAVASFREALRLRPEFAAASCNLSYVLYQLGHFAEARAYAEHALLVHPGFAEAHNHCGMALLELRRPQEAQQHFHRALELRPAFAEAHCNLGSALVDLGRLADGIASYQHSLRLQPALTHAHLLLADTFKMEGRFSEAVAHIRQALRIQPGIALAYCNLSEFAAQGCCVITDEELGRVRALLENGRLQLLERSLLNLTMANVLDRRGEYDPAFAHLREAGVRRQEWLQQIGRGFDGAAHHTLVDRVITTFDEAFFRHERLPTSASKVPVFVVGMPRSGTTLVEQILSSHSQVAGAGELHDLADLVKKLPRGPGGADTYPASFVAAGESDLRKLAESYLDGLARIGGPAAVHVIDKMSANFLYLGAIAVLFPRARIIHCCRDPLDVCLSCYFQNFKEVNYSWSLTDLGQYYREYDRLMRHWRRVLPLPMMEVRYEDLVARPEAVSRDLVAFCGLSWEDNCLAFHKNRRPVHTVSAVQVRRPIYASSIGRWRKYAAHVEPLRQALGYVPPKTAPASGVCPPPVLENFPRLHADAEG